jgi:hypothetical protein
MWDTSKLHKEKHMSITAEQATRLVEITQRKTGELFEELIRELQDNLNGPDGRGAPEELTQAERRAASNRESSEWTLGDTTLSGSWEEIGREEGNSYNWPDGNVDEYAEFVSYRGAGDYAGLTLALGYLDHGDVVGFVLGAGAGSKRGITYFFPADDFQETRDKISMIRGGGPRGRSGFGPGEALPSGYAGFKTDVLRDRRTGKWNVQGVVAKADDFDTMLGHTALQARLRGLG